MGQRSQIYIVWDNTKTKQKEIFARYFQWNYGIFMTSRAKQLIELIRYYCEQKYSFIFNDWQFKKELELFCDVNLDCRSISISRDIIDDFKEYNDYNHSKPNFSDYVFKNYDCNDGKLFIYIDTQNFKIKYAFTDNDITKILDTKDYIKWDCGNSEAKEIYEDNLFKHNAEFIKNSASLMSLDEINKIVNFKYSQADETPKIDYKKLARQLLIQLRHEISESETMEILQKECRLDEKQIREFTIV